MSASCLPGKCPVLNVFSSPDSPPRFMYVCRCQNNVQFARSLGRKAAQNFPQGPPVRSGTHPYFCPSRGDFFFFFGLDIPGEVGSDREGLPDLLSAHDSAGQSGHPPCQHWLLFDSASPSPLELSTPALPRTPPPFPFLGSATMPTQPPPPSPPILRSPIFGFKQRKRCSL